MSVFDRFTKPALSSVSIRGGVISVATGVALIAQEQYIEGISAVLGGLLGIWGRVKAEKSIKGFV